MIQWLDVTARIGAGLGLGAAIGMERQWRSRNAGLRTVALVSLGATLFVVMGGYSFSGMHDADPTRVAAQVASGGVRISATVIADERDDHEIEAALADVLKAPEVTAVRWTADELGVSD